ncbi:MAG: hypothetical protein ACFB9N_11095 [Geitlerinemataceae cyanobacterium]
MNISKFNLIFQQQERGDRVKANLAGFDEYTASEIRYFLNELQKNGGISNSEYLASMRVFIVKGHHCRIEYSREIGDDNIRIIDIVNTNFMESLSRKDELDDDEAVGTDTLPQYDSPEKILEALDLIGLGVNSPFDVAQKLGHKSKRDRDVSRHGQYIFKALDEQLKLVVRRCIKGKGKTLFAFLTDRGKQICATRDPELKKRLLVEAMIAYPLVREILKAITDPGSEEVLSNESVIKIAERRGPISAKTLSRVTAYRRAQAMKAWVIWIADYMFLPVREHKNGVQQNLFAGSLESLKKR